MPDMGCTLEAVRFNRPEGNAGEGPKAKYTHVGCMDARHRTKKGACSDWDPNTHPAYIIREEQSVHARTGSVIG